MRTRFSGIYSNPGAICAGIYLQSLASENIMACTSGSEKEDFNMAGQPLPEPGCRVDGSNSASSSWTAVPGIFRNSDRALPQPWEELFGPLRHGMVDDLMLVAQCGQSIDARIATPNGHS